MLKNGLLGNAYGRKYRNLNSNFSIEILLWSNVNQDQGFQMEKTQEMFF
jgi:hypothetical protein